MSQSQTRGPHVGASVHHLLNIKHEDPRSVTAGPTMYSFNPAHNTGTPIAGGSSGPTRSILLGSASQSKPMPDMTSDATPVSSFHPQAPGFGSGGGGTGAGLGGMRPGMGGSIPMSTSGVPISMSATPQQGDDSKRAMGLEEKKVHFDHRGLAASPSMLAPSSSSQTPQQGIVHASPAPKYSQSNASASSSAQRSRFTAFKAEDEDSKSQKSDQEETMSQLGGDGEDAKSEHESDHEFPQSSSASSGKQRPMSKADIERDKELKSALGELQDMGIKLSDGFVIKDATLDEKEDEYYRAQSRMELTDHMTHFHIKIKNFANTFAMVSVVLGLGMEFIAKQIHDKVERGDYKSVLRRHHQKYGSRPLNDPMTDIIYMTLDPIISNPFIPLIILGRLVQIFQGKASLNIPGLGGNAFQMPQPGMWPGMPPQNPQFAPQYGQPQYAPPYGYTHQQPQYQQPQQAPVGYSYGFAPGPQYAPPPHQPPQPQPQQPVPPTNPFAAVSKVPPPTTPAAAPSRPSQQSSSQSSGSIPRPSQSASDLQNLDVVWKVLPHLESSTQSTAEQQRLAQQHQLASRRGFSSADRLYDP